MDFIKPNVSEDSIYESTPIAKTPAGTYKNMRLDSLKARRAQSGNTTLTAFFVHTDKSGLAGVNYSAPITGTNKNGVDNGKNLVQFLFDMGVEKSAALSASFAIDGDLDALDPSVAWKGLPLVIAINGDVVSIAGRTATIVVEEYSANGKSATRAKAVYRN